MSAHASLAPAQTPRGRARTDVAARVRRVYLEDWDTFAAEAEKLYVEQVDLGEGKLRTVVSGLVDFMPPEALTNRRAVLICNLKPAKMRGVESEAMVLAASDVEHTKVELLDPPAAARSGAW